MTRSTFGVFGQRASSALQDAGGGRLADRDRAGDADDVGDLDLVLGEEEALRRLEQPLRRGDVEREQARQRQIDRDDLLEGDRIVERLQPQHLLRRQGERRFGAQARPLVPRKDPVGREAVVQGMLGPLIHVGMPPLL